MYIYISSLHTVEVLAADCGFQGFGRARLSKFSDNNVSDERSIYIYISEGSLKSFFQLEYIKLMLAFLSY